MTVGNRRAASWVWDVINVLNEALELEMLHLSDGNLTWRFHSRQPEFIQPIPKYLAPSVRPILKDFLRNNGDAKHALDEHDRRLGVAVQDAGAAFDALMANERFIAHAQQRLSEFGRAVWGGEKSLAECVVNHLESLPANWDAAELWEQHHAEFLAFGRTPEFATLDASKARLREHDQMVFELLEEKASALIAEHDLPAAPSPSAQLE